MDGNASGQGSTVVIGGTSGLGLEIARHYAATGVPVVITGRDATKNASVAGEVGPNVTFATLDLRQPKSLAAALSHVTGPIHSLVLGAIERDQNTVKDYDIDRAMELVTLKLVGYTEVVHALLDRLGGDSSIVILGGLAKELPYPGSTTVSTVNGGVVGMVRTMATELAPIRVNGLHPGIVGNSPYWSGKDATLDRTLARTPSGRLVRMEDIVHATVFLLENQAVNGVDLFVDGGWTIL